MHPNWRHMSRPMVCPKTTHLVIHYVLIIGATVMEDTNQSWLIKTDLQSVRTFQARSYTGPAVHCAQHPPQPLRQNTTYTLQETRYMMHNLGQRRQWSGSSQHHVRFSTYKMTPNWSRTPLSGASYPMSSATTAPRRTFNLEGGTKIASISWPCIIASRASQIMPSANHQVARAWW